MRPLSIAGRWAEKRLSEAGIDVPVTMVSGLVSGPGKMKAMEEFKSRLHNNSGLFSFPSPSYIRTSGMLFCTDVCSMGVDIPDLVVGVSLGKLTTIHVTDA